MKFLAAIRRLAPWSLRLRRSKAGTKPQCGRWCSECRDKPATTWIGTCECCMADKLEFMAR